MGLLRYICFSCNGLSLSLLCNNIIDSALPLCHTLPLCHALPLSSATLCLESTFDTGTARSHLAPRRTGYSRYRRFQAPRAPTLFFYVLQNSNIIMKASCALGTFFLGATALLHGATSAHQARSYWGPRSPHVVAAVSCNVIVDGVVLEGTVTFVRPIICDTPKVEVQGICIRRESLIL